MLKRLGIILFMIIITVGISACNPQEPTGKGEIEDLTEKIGQKKEVVFKDLELEEGKDIELSDNMVGIYFFNKKRIIHGEEFELGLNFDVNTEKMYGFTYVKEIDNNDKEGYDLIKKMFKELTEEYGEPDTYPGLPHKISDITDFEELGAYEYESFLETWKLNDGLTVELRANIVPDTGVLITLQYAELELPN